MTFEVSFKVDINSVQRETLEYCIKHFLTQQGLEPKDLFIVLREQPDFIPAIPAATYTKIPGGRK